MNNDNFNINENKIEHLPVLALRGLVIFPGNSASFDIGREESINAVQRSMKHRRKIVLVAQKDITKDHPTPEDLYPMGIVAEIKQVVRVSSDTLCAFVDGKYRVDLLKVVSGGGCLSADVLKINEIPSPFKTAGQTASVRLAKELFSQYVDLNHQISADVLINLNQYDDCGELVDYIAGNTSFDYMIKQELLENLDPYKRLEYLIETLMQENDLLQIEEDLQQRVKENMDQNQHEYYLREQLKVLQSELGEGEDDFEDLQRYRDTIQSLSIDAKSKQKLHKEVNRLAKMPPMSHEGAVIRSYLDIVLEMPFDVKTQDNLSLAKAQEILDRDHYGLTKVKERILEMLAVKQLSDLKGQILCLVGPPGVGKTSVAKSVAEAMGRNFARVSLGGVHDEAEIRGHRKTYIGAMPGRIMAAIENAGSQNPVILLDEIDKLCSDFKGDPAAALLEVLDPEQNCNYTDHFVDVPFDLSEVFFITTANSLDTIPRPLLDRMDVIEVPSYLEFEKIAIAKQHLIPKLRKAHGLNAKKFRINDATIVEIISGYTREAGVRNLERLISKLMRKAARQLVQGDSKSVSVTVKNLEKFLGPKQYKDEELYDGAVAGIANGLAWTSVGGEMLNVEVIVLDGNGKLELTGSLGEVMKESAKIAISFIRSIAEKYGLDIDFYKAKDIRIHFPEGAVPKDGPSAGITVATAIFSALSGIPVSNKIAMTGEVTLNGRVLPIGGLKEKSTAALKHGIKTVIIPKDNLSDTFELDKSIQKQIKFLPVSDMQQVLEYALIYSPNIVAQEKSEILTIADKNTVSSARIGQ